MVHRNTSRRTLQGQNENNPSPARFGAVEEFRASFPRGCQLARILPSCHRRIHRLVLLRTSFGFSRAVVLCYYRFFLEQKNLAPSTINVRLAAVRQACLRNLRHWPSQPRLCLNSCCVALVYDPCAADRFSLSGVANKNDVTI
jgi:hypothetical protein